MTPIWRKVSTKCFFPCLLSWRWTKMHVWVSAVLCHAWDPLFQCKFSYAALAKWFCVITCWNTMVYICVLDPSICVWGSFICMFTIFLINAIKFFNLVPLYFLLLYLYVLLTAKIIWTCEYEFKICHNYTSIDWIKIKYWISWKLSF